jgi:hypothetical protein
LLEMSERLGQPDNLELPMAPARHRRLSGPDNRNGVPNVHSAQQSLRNRITHFSVRRLARFLCAAAYGRWMLGRRPDVPPALHDQPAEPVTSVGGVG